MEVSGVFLLSIARACVSLRVLAGREWDDILSRTQPDRWYPSQDFHRAMDRVIGRFRDPDPVLERVGEEMMRAWYTLGPGNQLAPRGVDFLSFQASSRGYRSLVRGEEAEVGGFTLEELDETGGRARVRSTTPFPRPLERGVLRGGTLAAGDLDFVSVTNTADPSVFEIRFR